LPSSKRLTAVSQFESDFVIGGCFGHNGSQSPFAARWNYSSW
jgi:hypothetical protein